VRELYEETGLTVKPEALKVAHIIHGAWGVEAPNGFLTVVFAAHERRALSDRSPQGLHGGELALCPPRGIETHGELPCNELQKPALGVRVEAVRTCGEIFGQFGGDGHRSPPFKTATRAEAGCRAPFVPRS
jgi:8-oxo-dGTP pyrophosphatase MutT (NUDIX family)